MPTPCGNSTGRRSARTAIRRASSGATVASSSTPTDRTAGCGLRGQVHVRRRAAAAVPGRAAGRAPAGAVDRLGHQGEAVVPPLSARAHRPQGRAALDAHRRRTGTRCARVPRDASHGRATTLPPTLPDDGSAARRRLPELSRPRVGPRCVGEGGQGAQAATRGPGASSPTSARNRAYAGRRLRVLPRAALRR